MTVQRGKKLSISIQEHMAIDVCPGPIRPIRQISAYFPRLSPTSPPPTSPNPALSPNPSPVALSPPAAAAVGGPHLLSPLRAHSRWGGAGSSSQNSSMDTSVEINSDDSDDCTALGTLEFELRYDQSCSELHCTMLRAKGLKPMDFNGLADPYVKLHLLPGASKVSRSQVHHDSVGPAEPAGPPRFCWTSRTCRSTTVLLDQQFSSPRRTIKNPDQLPSPGAMGEALRGISCYLREWENEQLHSLEERGRLLLALQFRPPVCGGGGGRRSGGLCVAVKRCAHLAAMDVNGFSDPYVKMKPPFMKGEVLPSPGSLQEFFYEISLSELAKKTLEVTVWDYDLGRSNDFIGGVCLSCRSQGDALRHWMDCLKNKGRWVERWHILTNELPRSFSHD
uniref:Double C2-like domains, alpha n=1 Tax=Fundulus heteroclitus TaxID=8078 RepID=A0A3Q2UQ09_FUNHE